MRRLLQARDRLRGALSHGIRRPAKIASTATSGLYESIRLGENLGRACWEAFGVFFEANANHGRDFLIQSGANALVLCSNLF